MSASTVASERRCVVVDWQCREREGKVKIEGYMSVSDEEAHHHREFAEHYLADLHFLYKDSDHKDKKVTIFKLLLYIY